MGEASTIPFCLCDVFRHRPSLRKVYPRLNQATRYLFGLLFLALRVVYWSAWILPCDGPHLPLCGLYALLGLQYMWGAQIVKKLIRPFVIRCVCLNLFFSPSHPKRNIEKLSMIYFSAIHHTGVSLTHHALCRWGFDYRHAKSSQGTSGAVYFACTLWFVACSGRFLPCNMRCSYIGSDAVLMLRLPQFNKMENWLHHILTAILVLYSIVDKTRHYDLIHLGGIGELSFLWSQTHSNISLGCRSVTFASTKRVALFIVSFVTCVLVVVRDVGRDEDATLHHRLLCLLRYLNDAVLLVFPYPSMVLQGKRKKKLNNARGPFCAANLLVLGNLLFFLEEQDLVAMGMVGGHAKNIATKKIPSLIIQSTSTKINGMPSAIEWMVKETMEEFRTSAVANSYVAVTNLAFDSVNDARANAATLATPSKSGSISKVAPMTRSKTYATCTAHAK